MAVLYRNTIMIRANNAKWVAVQEGDRKDLSAKQAELEAKGFTTLITNQFQPELV